MAMENGSGLSASDVLALTRNNNSFLGGDLGATLGIIIVFILLFGGNGAWGNNNFANALGQSDLQNALYFQSQDNAIRSIANGQCGITEQVMSSNYDNALLLKDLSNQMSNSVAAIGNQIANQTTTITNMFNQQTIDHLREALSDTKDQLSNANQTATITSNILNSLGKWRAFPPCYDGCGCSNSLY